MQRLSKLREIFDKNSKLIIITLSLIFLALLLLDVPFLQSTFSNLVNVDYFLEWHNTLEIASIIFCVSIFCVTYYTYEQTKNFRLLLLGGFLLIVSFLDFFHTMTYTGMPEFLINNIQNRSTTLWIIARLFGGVAFLLISVLPHSVKFRFKKIIFIIIPISISLIVMCIVTFYPNILPVMFAAGKGITDAKILSEYIIILLFAGAIIAFLARYKKSKDTYFFLLASAICIGVFSELAFVMYSSVYDFYNYLGHLLKFIMYFIIFRAIFIRTVRRPFWDLLKAKDKIKDYADNQDKIVEQRTKEINEIHKKLLEDLEYAKDIQLSMMPQELPQVKGVDFAANYFPAERVGGDFYNIFQLENDKIGVYIGDVSGHGVSAAMLTVFVNQSIVTTNEIKPGIFESISPSAVLKNLYNSYNKSNFKEEVYVVMIYGVFDIKTKEFVFSSAGMNVQPIIVNSSGLVSELGIKGFPICKLQEYHNEEYQETTVKLKRGDKILFYTDGLVDDGENAKHVFSEMKLNLLLSKGNKMNAREIEGTITKEVRNYIKNNKVNDDITYFILEVE